MAMYMVKPWYKKEEPSTGIFGAEWDGSSSTSLTRTDDSANFSDPVPYYPNMSGSPSSPFDRYLPWSGMRVVEDSTAGSLVEIPKYYWKLTLDGLKMKWQISSESFEGSLVSPAHADRGDGEGERDYVYVGRYHCNSNYKSATGVAPIRSMTRAAARTNIHGLGTNIYQFDFAMWWTINMLYLVEFANWDSQIKIGLGSGNNTSVQNNGVSDTMPYHTGSMTNNRDYGVGVQYRYIENLWANVMTWCDGIYFNNTNTYCIKNPNNFSDTENGVFVGTRATNGGKSISKWTDPSSISGYEYALNAAEAQGTQTTYVTDYYNYSKNSKTGVVLQVGGYYSRIKYWGLFCLYEQLQANASDATIGCRLMVLPPARLSAA